MAAQPVTAVDAMAIIRIAALRNRNPGMNGIVFSSRLFRPRHATGESEVAFKDFPRRQRSSLPEFYLAAFTISLEIARTLM